MVMVMRHMTNMHALKFCCKVPPVSEMKPTATMTNTELAEFVTKFSHMMNDGKKAHLVVECENGQSYHYQPTLCPRGLCCRLRWINFVLFESRFGPLGVG